MLAVPATLHDSLMARLDRVPELKRLAQIGSVIGRRFSHEMLKALSSMPEQALADGLEQMGVQVVARAHRDAVDRDQIIADLRLIGDVGRR